MKKFSKALISSIALVAALATPFANGADTDIFSGIQATGYNPNLLFVLDNSGAWNASASFACPSSVMTLPANNANTAGGFEQCALYNVLQSLANNTYLIGKINMGLMLFGTGSTNGGTFFFPSSANPGPLPAMNATGLASFETAVAGLQVGGSVSNTANASAVGATMQEAWAFYSGLKGFSGTTYTTPVTSACQKNFVVYIANANNMGKPQDNTDNTVFSTLACTAGSFGPSGASCGGASTAQQAQIPLNAAYNKYQSNWGDEWSRFNYQTDISGNFNNQQDIVTYTIAVTDGSNPNYVEFLRSMAANGGGKMFVVTLGDMNGLVQAILQILNEVQAVNSVFASASLPVSANAQGTYQNQIFMGMFRPDPVGNPRWLGNLKQYQFGVDTSSGGLQLYLADATGAHALSSSGTGFLSPNAISFWTSKNTAVAPDSTGGFWVNDVQGVGAGYDLPDGEVVEKGGVAQQIRLANLVDDYTANPTAPRNVYTYCPAGTACTTQLSASANAFATTNSNITGAMLNATGSATPITSITRTSSTATVTLSSTPTPPLAAGQTATITGSQGGYDGTYTIGTVPTANSFTIAVTPIPPTPATGTYIASIPSATLTVSSLTRSSTSNTTAIVTTSTPHGMAAGQQFTISGSTSGTYSTDPHYSAYYGTFTVLASPAPTATTFAYTVAEGPATPLDAAGGTATVGSATDTFTTSTSATLPAFSIQRAASTLVGGVWTSQVTVTTTTAMTLPFASGASVKIAGTNTVYDGTWTISAVSNCPGGLKSQGKSYSFCFNMPTTPNMPDPAPTIYVTPVSGSVMVSSLTRGPSSCPTSNAATATVTTVTAHGFAPGQLINMGGTPGINENAYVGNVTVISVPTSTSFTYSVNTRPLCSDTSAGMIATVASGSGGTVVTRDTLIRWVRGEDNFGDEPSPGNPINIRPSVHGDVVHARPTVVNYGGNIGVVVYYGAGDGTFRAINGNQPGATPSSIGSTPPGGELWSFIAPEFYYKLMRLHNNSPMVQYYSTPSGIVPTPLPKEYFFDGIAGLYQNYNTGQAYIYLSARRGGNVIYALDVSNPANPVFMWKHTSADVGFGELGQTWSQPKVAIVKGNANPVLIFGAGYDQNEDAEPPAADTMGRGIFILDAVTGNLLWRAGPGGGSNSCSGTTCLLQGMTYATPADVTLLDTNSDGYVDRAYAADLGGNIWRVDFEPAGGNTPSSWQVNLLAALGGASTDATKRKFFYPPDAVTTNNFTAVMAVTGDREHPLYPMQATSIVNRFYMIKDLKTGLDGSGLTPAVDNTSDTTDTQPASLFNATNTPYTSSPSDSGYYVTLVNAGEKGVNAPTTVGGYTYFGTNQPVAPAPNTCQSNLGVARSYQIGFLTGKTASNLLQGGGLPPSPVAGLVSLQINGQTIRVPFLIGGTSQGCSGADCQSALGAQRANIPVTTTRHRAYWYRETDRQ